MDTKTLWHVQAKLADVLGMSEGQVTLYRHYTATTELQGDAVTATRISDAFEAVEKSLPALRLLNNTLAKIAAAPDPRQPALTDDERNAIKDAPLNLVKLNLEFTTLLAFGKTSGEGDRKAVTYPKPLDVSAPDIAFIQDILKSAVMEQLADAKPLYNELMIAIRPASEIREVLQRDFVATHPREVG